MKELTLSIAVFVFSFMICVTCGVTADSMILDYKDVQFFKVHEKRNGATISLELSGLAFHSSLAVENIKTHNEDDSIVVLVYLTLARNALTGSFDYTLDVPENVNFVYFGTSKQLIWKR